MELFFGGKISRCDLCIQKLVSLFCAFFLYERPAEGITAFMHFCVKIEMDGKRWLRPSISLLQGQSYGCLSAEFLFGVGMNGGLRVSSELLM